MNGQTDNYSAAEVFDHYFNQLRDSTVALLRRESQYQQDIRDLSINLDAFKEAYRSAENAKRELEQKLEISVQASEREKQYLENQITVLKGSERRVICLIDGDGTIFSTPFIAKGQEGGHSAAKALSEYILQDLSSKGLHQFQLWVYVFYNKRGLLETFGRAGLWEARNKFDEFVMGFNQAAERFLMVDVGSGKEAADAKIKVHMEDIRLPHTIKIVFGGCHDNGYVTTLRSLITAGFHDKLMLLRGYTDMAAGIEELELPSIAVPQLFMADKIVTLNTGAAVASGPPPGLGLTKARSFSISGNVFEKAAPPPTSGPVIDSVVRSNTVPAPAKPAAPQPSYASALQTVQVTHEDRPETPGLDHSGSSASSDISDGPMYDPRASPPLTRPRHINPALALSKQKPPPCTLFYLADCRHGANCKYGHDYILEDHHYDEIRRNAKNAPCPAVNRGEECTWGEKCCYGHVCPQTTKCFYFKQGRCKFVGEAMHKDTV